MVICACQFETVAFPRRAPVAEDTLNCIVPVGNGKLPEPTTGRGGGICAVITMFDEFCPALAAATVIPVEPTSVMANSEKIPPHSSHRQNRMTRDERMLTDGNVAWGKIYRSSGLDQSRVAVDASGNSQLLVKDDTSVQ